LLGGTPATGPNIPATAQWFPCTDGWRAAQTRTPLATVGMVNKGVEKLSRDPIQEHLVPPEGRTYMGADCVLSRHSCQGSSFQALTNLRRSMRIWPEHSKP